jgi:hypothetical protein
MQVPGLTLMRTRQRSRRIDASTNQHQTTKGADMTITASIRTAVAMQGLFANHAETLVRTPVITQGISINHAETLVRTPVVMQGFVVNHAETIVAR